MATISRENSLFCSSSQCSYPGGESPETLSVVAENIVGNSSKAMCSASKYILFFFVCCCCKSLTLPCPPYLSLSHGCSHVSEVTGPLCCIIIIMHNEGSPPPPTWTIHRYHGYMHNVCSEAGCVFCVVWSHWTELHTIIQLNPLHHHSVWLCVGMRSFQNYIN